MTHAISVKGISKSFGRIRALQDVSFDVPPHSIYGLLGPNGAGKTTLFSITANFLKARAGTIEVLGIDTRRIYELQGRLSILPQDARFQRNVPILEQLVFFRLLGGRSKTEAQREVMETLEMVGLHAEAKRRVGSLSHGMVKRLGIAQAFLGQPEVILLDEPTSGLDPANARQIRDLIKQLQQRATIMVSSHNMAEIQELCDHVAILDHGKLVLAGSVDDITRADREYFLYLSRELQEGELEQVGAIKGIRRIEKVTAPAGAGGKKSAQYLVRLDLSAEDVDQDAIITSLLRCVLDLGVTPRRLTEGRSLETQFLQLTSQNNQQ